MVCRIFNVTEFPTYSRKYVYQPTTEVCGIFIWMTRHSINFIRLKQWKVSRKSFACPFIVLSIHTDMETANNKNSFKNHTSSVGKKIVIKRCIFWYDKNIFLVDLRFQSSFLKKKLNQMEFLNEKCCVFNLETRHFKFLRTKSLLKVELLKKYGRL